ncbi:signal peptidase I [Tellurirhabdus rosea]|uniref:signal peptidase I n=1 Tax=Tellurirhabdus rosea TaxID=2674997 RepID=UPI00224CF92D|nr:signal peptidase I [Tellurirhabdus rosea]
MFRTKPKTTKADKGRKPAWKEWLDSLVFAVVAATVIRFFTFTAFAIPTPSMEGSLLVGDFLFVSKLHYGALTPKTPLQIPLTHQKIWGTNLPSYSRAIQLPAYRLPGFTTVKNGDVVVFNYPPPIAGEPDHPSDLRTNYIKRCVGIPGDVLTVKLGEVYVNDRKLPLPEDARSSYFIRTTEPLGEAFFRRYGIVNDFNSAEGPFINWQPLEAYDAARRTSVPVGYRVFTSRRVVEELKALDWVQGIEPVLEQPGRRQEGIYGGSVFPWNIDNFGPVRVPRKGMTVPINRETIALYGPVIQRYEGHEMPVVTATTVEIDGKPLKTYTFRQDYYFMMGDNRHNSEDSRFWGFVPEDHIVGKAVFVWMSLDPAPKNGWNAIRWNHLFSPVR